MTFTYMLAPLEDMTSNSFRTLCYRHGCDLTFTELTRVEGLAKNNKSTWTRLDFHDDTPTVVQLLGAKEDHFKRFLKVFEPHKGFKGFNLNMGCPAPAMVKIGQGCALVRRISKAKKLVGIFRDSNYRISIKMRLGLNQHDKDVKAYLNLIDAVDADFFVVHARHGAQTYAEPADFSVYEECVKTGKTIIANGDINSKEKIGLLKDAGVKGAMIGRWAILDPAIFARLKWIDVPPNKRMLDEYTKLADSYGEPFKYRKNILRRSGKKASEQEEEHA